MADDWIDVPYYEQPAASAAPDPGDWVEVPFTPPKPRDWADRLNDWSAEAIQGTPFGEEIGAGLASAADYLGLSGRAAMGKGPSPDYTNLYGQNRKELIQGQKRFEDEHGPLAEMGAQFIGGLPLAFLFPAAQTAGQALKMGAGLGALYGAGVAEDENGQGRLANAAMMGAGGAVLGPAAYGLTKGAGALLKSAPVQRGIDTLMTPFRGEAGAILPEGGVRALPHLSPEESALVKYAQQVPLETLEGGLSQMDEAARAGIPMAIPEATDSPTLLQLNRYVASNDATDVARKFIEGRKDATVARIGEELNTIAPESSVMEGFGSLKDAASKLAQRVTERRTGKATPYYEEAIKVKPLIDHPEVEAALKSDIVSREVKRLKGNFPEEFGNLPDNHFRVVDRVKQRLDGLISKAKLAGDNSEVRDLTLLKNKLIKAETLPEYDQARAVFARHSRLVNEVVGGVDPETGKKMRGLLNGLLSIDENTDITRIGRELMAKRPEQLGRIRRVFGKQYRDNLEAGVRAHLQYLAESKKHGPTAVIDFVLSDDGGKKLAAVLGQKKAGELARLMKLERSVQKGNLASYSGSQTQPLQEIGKRMSGVRKLIAKVFTNPAGAAGDVADAMVADVGGIDASVMKGLAEVLNSPERGREALANIAQYRGVLEPRLKEAENLIGAVRMLGQPGAAQGGQALIPDTQAPAPGKPPGGDKLAMALPGAALMAPSSQEPEEAQYANVNAGGNMPASPQLIEAIIAQESGGNPRARSSAGAQGLMQLMPATGREWHRRLGLPGSYDPYNEEQNRTIGTAYINHLIDYYNGDEPLALAAFNWGMGRVDRALRRAQAAGRGQDFNAIAPYLPDETANYVPSVIQRMA